MARRDLDEGRPELGADALGLGHQGPADAALAGTRIDHEGEDPQDPVVVLEPWQGMDGDEAEHRAVVLGDDHPRVRRREPLQALDDVAGSGGIALVGEQLGDRVGVVGRRPGGG